MIYFWSMNTQQINTFQETHLSIWNEKDRVKRDALMHTIYADGIKMYDRDFILTGHTEISNFIDKLLTDDPQFFFTAAKPMESTQNGIRFFWNIRTGGPILTGMDFFMLENDKVIHLYVFMDAGQ